MSKETSKKERESIEDKVNVIKVIEKRAIISGCYVKMLCYSRLACV